MKFKDPKDQITYDLIDRLQRLVNRLHRSVGNFSRELAFMKYKMQFGERDDDIYIVTFPKSGTTLMQMMLYQMTTDGRMDFEHIYEVSPWIRNDVFRKKAPPNLPSPRLIKSHDPYHKFDRNTKGRFIFVIRNGMDAALSLYHQNKNYNNSQLDFDDFFRRTFVKKHSMNYFQFMKAWLRNKKNLPVLFVHFEDIVHNFDVEMQRVAEFCQIELTAEAAARTRERCRFEYMKAHEDKFGEQPPPPRQRVYDQFIRKGKTGEGKANMKQEQVVLFEERYSKELAPYLKK